MPTPPGFNNTVIHVTFPTLGGLNAVIEDQNNTGYWLTDLRFIGSTDAFLLFCKYNIGIYGYVADQKLNQVAANQASLDADKATENDSGYWPTGIFPTPDAELFVLYQQLDQPPAP
jgi:hypothetical protein